MVETIKNTTLYLPNRVTFDNAVSCTAALSKSLQNLQGQDDTQGVSYIEVNASAVEEFDSSVLAVLLQLWRDAAKRNKTLKVIHMSDKLKELSQLYGVEHLLTQGLIST